MSTEVTEKNFNKVLDDLNTNLIRADRWAREMEVLMLEQKYKDEENKAIIRMCNMLLELKEAIDSINNLFHYTKTCVDTDQIHIAQLAREAKVELIVVETD